MSMTYFIGLWRCLIFLLAIQLFCLGGVNFRGGAALCFWGYIAFSLFSTALGVASMVAVSPLTGIGMVDGWCSCYDQNLLISTIAWVMNKVYMNAVWCVAVSCAANALFNHIFVLCACSNETCQVDVIFTLAGYVIYVS